MSTSSLISDVFNEDCLIGMARYPDKFFDLAIVDPEYGRGEDGGKDRTTFSLQKDGSKRLVKCGNYTKKSWDKVPAGPEYFVELLRVSKRQIVWGENYYGLSLGPGRIIWDKVNDGSDQSACEIAYYSGHTRVDLIRYMWRGMMQGKSITEGMTMNGNVSTNEKRIHPTQKPVVLYKWLLAKYGNGGHILYTHMGSQSSRIAAFNMGFDYTGFELDPDYFIAGNKRFAEQTAQSSLYSDPDSYTTGPEY